MTREKEFTSIVKGVPIHRVERAFGMLTPGVNWSRCGIPTMRECYAGRAKYLADGSKITADQLRAAIATVME